MNIGWRDKALRRAVLLSLLLLAACGYCLYQFSQAQKAHSAWPRCRGRHASSSNCRRACRWMPLRASNCRSGCGRARRRSASPSSP
ncbi:hypothetical protein M5585_25525 [Serratia ureilytica]